ncbi:NAD-dependent epimerase/dehydratase family protein [Pontimicrobium aquaticum]|uniref:NAD-dependent epimerase/dehydratase family protein n=1 Tax=Pontimicrobium aquaticum TaxID=2565367 RepID=A0A4V5LRC8_9FLAO|nr:NAD-dependent epimerase/dehydratase family protein [Pontimicrobium aquaticum]TJY37969.1 NAD-dependent epimerase/dehydratase family protein [Pontimicrobium aquaticum]
MILVTGGTGLVGSHLLYQLVVSGKAVRAIYRTKKKIKAVKKVFSYYSEDYENLFAKIEWFEATLNNIPQINEAFKDITYVYHCAAFISFDPKDYHTLRRVNIEGTANIVNLSVSQNVKKLCYVSSIATIGKKENNLLITEETHWNPEAEQSVYSITKYGAEMEVWRGTQEGLDAVIVNPGVIIGSGFWRGGGSGSLIKLVYKGFIRLTEGVVGYVSVKDVANTMIKLMESNIINERYILVSDNLSYTDFFTKTANYLNVKAPQKKASKFLLSIAWRLDWLRSKLFNKKRRLVKQTTKTITTKSYYSNNKIKNAIDYNFAPIDEYLPETCQFFLKEL